jgi:hypothetical protein
MDIWQAVGGDTSTCATWFYGGDDVAWEGEILVFYVPVKSLMSI